ncbi:hypothetical protein [Sphingobium sp.]|uniref:hypothetical protein n=1 Tax=Sphingobium sp. TaxID=1912891 RepID=UPI002C55C08B|nr:hypothetical protein [Sphingobium sp.]HUD91741.1 hypothetical protein [Sphingobium sp.]
MPKLNDRDRLADLEARQSKIAQEILDARRALRGKYASILNDMEVEKLSEKDFRDLVQHAIRVGGPASITALKGITPTAKSQLEKRP